ncbi:MAG: hypothetical protein Ct9H300mP16_12610 [Pseudomonadota bacterium]|nr:MAG: hypothetical protein Ct9H300mP16_12610 [Pseudomonadota bacterium]
MRRSEFRPVYFALLILVILGGYFGVKILTSTDSPSPASEQNLAQFELPTSRGDCGHRIRFRKRSWSSISGPPGVCPAGLKYHC